MDESTERQIREELGGLRHEHRNLAASIEVLSTDGKTDPVHLQHLKKEKLAMKDRIAKLEDRLLPDIIA